MALVAQSSFSKNGRRDKGGAVMDLKTKLEAILPVERVKARLIDVLSFAADAGFYSLTPMAVVQPINEDEIIALFKLSNVCGVPLVFRAGGTSLSGQSITDGILVDLSQHWNGVKVEADGELVRVLPGITGGMVNSHLRKYSRKIGPDPASISAAMMGGIVSNNSSGMCCGTKLNSYHTTKYIKFILPGGKTFTTESPLDYTRFEQECNELFAALAQMRKYIIGHDVLRNKIKEKFLVKNTVGYSINALIDFEHPLDIFAHLLIGGEGTLAFIAEVVMHTVIDYRFKSTALLYFPDVYAACQAIAPLNNAGARAVELMDRASLRAVEKMPQLPALIKQLPAGAAALLVEFQENDFETLQAAVNTFLQQAPNLSLLHSPVFTSDVKEQAYFWMVRKGLFPSVGALRARGSTVILEDVTFPVANLGAAILELQQLFQKYAYTNAIIFGHAKDGNIHFVITPDFSLGTEISRYDRFIADVVELVVGKYGGALKAEHGTGRNMAPFVETEWGPELYRIMAEIKKVADPYNLLNPGVIINEDKKAHIKNIKGLPEVEKEVDKCIECGYCEHKCPSRNITATPRRRIVIRRALQRFKKSGDTVNHKLLLKQYQYDGMDTCAVDGLCATVCPVDIDTGELIKRLRRENHSGFANKMAVCVARNFKVVLHGVRFALGFGAWVNQVFGAGTMLIITSKLKRFARLVPLWGNQLIAPPGLSALNCQPASSSTEKVLYYPSCISRIFGSSPEEGKKNMMETFLSVSAKAGIAVKFPEGVNHTCCSQLFSSKGYAGAHRYMANKFVDTIWQASEQGALKIVIDVSSCAFSLKNLKPHLNETNKIKYDSLTILDCVDYLHDMVMPRQLQVAKKGKVVVHPVCSLQKMNTTDKFIKLANCYAEEVTVPFHAGCCGMAGDRGFLFPELTNSATLPEALEVAPYKFDGYYSSTKTCEMALSQATQKNYESILYLLDEAISD
jgi:D-lactate dehydrogenase